MWEGAWHWLPTCAGGLWEAPCLHERDRHRPWGACGTSQGVLPWVLEFWQAPDRTGCSGYSFLLVGEFITELVVQKQTCSCSLGLETSLTFQTGSSSVSARLSCRLAMTVSELELSRVHEFAVRTRPVLHSQHTLQNKGGGLLQLYCMAYTCLPP